MMPRSPNACAAPSSVPTKRQSSGLVGARWRCASSTIARTAYVCPSFCAGWPIAGRRPPRGSDAERVVKVCIVSHSATGLTTRPSGGSELQSALLATGLSARGHDVTFVVPGLTGEERTVSGVRLRSGWDPDRGVRFVRALTYRYPHLRRVLRATGPTNTTRAASGTSLPSWSAPPAP